MKLHKLVEPARLRQIRERWLDLNARRREALLEPSGRIAPRYRGFLETSVDLAGSAMALELGDASVREHLADAVDAAHNWLTAETGPATRGLRRTLVDAVVDDSGRSSFETTKLEPPDPFPGGKENWHIGVFSLVLDTLVAFGPVEAAREAAAAREEWYRSTEVVAEEAFFADVRGKKRWLLDDDAGARAACEEAVRTAERPFSSSTSRGLLALIDGKPQLFHGALADVVKAHQRSVRRDPTRADGVLTLEGLALCRMARTYGIEIAEQTYLPVRFLAPGLLRAEG